MSIIDATLAGPNSNSYIDLAEASAIAQTLPFAADWAATPNDDLERALIVATRWLDTLDYKGERCSETQRLKWPRDGAECDGQVSTCDEIPYAIKEATVILAWKYIEHPESFQVSVVLQEVALPLARTSSVRRLMSLRLSTTSSTPTSTTTTAVTVTCQPSSRNSPGWQTYSVAGSNPRLVTTV